ncbi:MAG: acyl-CoA dehydrogenase family protein [Acidobacteria bacterium]|nr:acyl-CoA dehydrogenase family protein [Acidobacteriota bacterium]
MTVLLDTHEILDRLAETIRVQGQDCDRDDTFVAKNLLLLKEAGLYRAMIPEELGGGGISHSAMCQFLRELARFCGATALTLSMHQHLVAVQVFNYRNGKPAEAMLRRIAAEDLILVSTGGGDWLSSNGEAERVEGGYRVSCVKHFASGAPIADIAVMSCAYTDEQGDEFVIHCGIPFSDPGVTILDNWEAMGMRGSGSHSVRIDRVFVPDEKIPLIRPRGAWHPVWEVVCTFAFPLFMAPYVGVAEAMKQRVLELLDGTRAGAAVAASLGEMDNQLRIAQLALEDMIRQVDDGRVKPSLETANRAMTGKALISIAAREAAAKAMEAAGGRAFMRRSGLEKLFRDVWAAEFHPIQASRQRELAGRIMLGGTPADLAD